MKRICVIVDTGFARIRRSARVAESGADAVDGGGDGSVEFSRFGGVGCDGAFAADEFDLDEGHGIDVGITEADRAL